MARNEATVDTLTAVQQEQQDKLKYVRLFLGHVEGHGNGWMFVCV